MEQNKGENEKRETVERVTHTHTHTHTHTVILKD